MCIPAKEILNLLPCNSPFVCLFVCLLTGLCKHNWLDLHEKYEKICLGPTLIPINLESDPDHWLDKKTSKSGGFAIYLLMSHFYKSNVAEVCTHMN